ncbi:hypothetical protein KY329_04845, partial [Candidatus Woesearchaeota archaeon]|nr:hypothetical protein [Candidatus Woesearchaeota archaeon]
MNKSLVAFALLVLLVLTACGDEAVPWVPVNPPALQPVAGMLNYDYYVGTAAEKKYTFDTCPGGPKPGGSGLTCGGLDFWWYSEIEGGDPVVFNELKYRTWQPEQHGCNWQKFNLAIAKGPVYITNRRNVVRTWQTLGGANWGSAWHSYPPVDLSTMGISFGVLDAQLGIYDIDARDKTCTRRYELTFDYTKDLVEKSDSIELRDNIVELGTIAELIGSSTALFDLLQNKETVRVFSPDQVSIGFGTYDPGSITEWKINSQADFDQMIYACLDEDKNGICDYGRAQLCYNMGGDFYKDVCCGVDVNAPVCSYVQSVEAYCADTAAGPKWLPLRDAIGTIVAVAGTCGISVDAISDGSGFKLCGGSSLDPVIDSITSEIADGTVFSVTNTKNKTHDYVCANDKFTECGALAPFSSIQNAGIG